VNSYFGEDGKFKGAMYQPFRYEEGVDDDSQVLDLQGNRSFQQQRNLYDTLKVSLTPRSTQPRGWGKAGIIFIQRIVFRK
ncbi:MAG: hypothetical protein OQL18_08060, partial [Deltaproteobacteria bacterium]|nr:hypothetical protein [Deltaproteobacteria bacterium]